VSKCLRRLTFPNCSECRHSGDISPELLEASRSSEQCREMCRVHEDNITQPFAFGRHPKDDVEFGFSGRGERMRTFEINGLAGQHADAIAARQAASPAARVR